MDIHKIYEQMARQHGVSVEEIRRKMQAAIHEAYQNPTDEEAAERQSRVLRTGEIPTPEEMMIHVLKQLNKDETS